MASFNIPRPDPSRGDARDLIRQDQGEDRRRRPRAV